MASLHILFNQFAQLNAVNARHHHVGKHDVHLLFLENRQSLLTVSGSQCGVLRLEVAFQVVHHFLVVVDQQNCFGRFSGGSVFFLFVDSVCFGELFAFNHCAGCRRRRRCDVTAFCSLLILVEQFRSGKRMQVSGELDGKLCTFIRFAGYLNRSVMFFNQTFYE